MARIFFIHGKIIIFNIKAFSHKIKNTSKPVNNQIIFADFFWHTKCRIKLLCVH
jgi:hypothetical protein